MSVLITDIIQLGQSANPDYNFNIVNNGTASMVISTGNALGPVTPILTATATHVEFNGNVTFDGNVTAIESFVGDGSYITGTAPGLTSGNVTYIPTLTGDVSSVFNSVTLNTVNTSPGTYGNPGNVAQVSVDNKGLVTSVSSITIMLDGGYF